MSQDGQDDLGRLIRSLDEAGRVLPRGLRALPPRLAPVEPYREPPPPVVVRRLPRVEAQRAVGRVPLRDVLVSLKRSNLILRFRLTESVVIVHAESALPFLFESNDLS